MPQTFTLNIDDENFAIITIDSPDKSVNVLSFNVFSEVEDIFSKIEQTPNLKGVIFISGKADNFIAGANVDELEQLRDEKATLELSQKAQKVFNRLSKLPVPTAVAIHGTCVGGGLELSLACTYRIASDSPKTTLALPEVMIGVIPGAGGTQRLTRLLGLREALDMILTGKNVRAQKAYKIGLVNEVVPRQTLITAAKAWIKGTVQPKLKRKGIIHRFLNNTRLGRALVYKGAKKQLLKKSGGFYPAPLLALESSIKGLEDSFDKGLELESRNFAKTCITDVSKNLIHIFHSTIAIKKDMGTRNKDTKPKTVTKVGILGAGLMGSGLATVLADKGFFVRVKDVSPEVFTKLYKYADKMFCEKLNRKHINQYEFNQKMSRITTTKDYSGFKNAGIVIEAVFEDLELKQQMVRDIEENADEQCIFASNTSSIPITKIAKASKHPGTVIGMHFFSPVEKMQLVEVIVTKETEDWVTATAVQLGKDMGKYVIVVNDGTGFYTSRILAPYINEACHILIEGGDIGSIDKAMRNFGFPVGPLTLMDEVGIDVVTKVFPVMLEAYGERLTPPEGWDAIIKDGRLGRKNKKGFYTYTTKKKQVDRSIYKILPFGNKRKAFPESEIQKRIVSAFMNEAVLALQENVLRSPRDGDIGAIFGLGFPPFFGGPFKYLDKIGVDTLLKDLQELTGKYGKRFQPAELLKDMSDKKTKFYST